jgi:hypothetical protein
MARTAGLLSMAGSVGFYLVTLLAGVVIAVR